MSAPALAVENHLPLSFSPFGSFSLATGVAVDQSTGNVFVADSRADVVRVYDAEGAGPVGGIPSELTGALTPSGGFNFHEEPVGVAVDNACFYHKLSGGACTAFDPSNGAIYVTDVLNNVVDKFVVNGSDEYEYVSQFTGFSEPVGVAVDREGDVYVSDYRNSSIHEYDLAGIEVNNFTVSGETAHHPFELALDSSGDIYVHGFSPEDGLLRLKRSSFAGAVESEEVIVGHEQPPFVRGLAFDQATGRLYLGRESPGGRGFFLTDDDEAGNTQFTFDFKESVSSQDGGIAVNETTGYVYNPDAGRTAIEAFGPLVVIGTATTGVASGVGPNSATVEGAVNPESETLEGGCEVQYGKTTAYGQSVPCSPEKVGTGEKPVPVTAELVGLEASTLYHYRVVAVNKNGANPGPDATLTTAPAVQGVLTGEATDITKVSATLNGSLKPNGITTHYYFEYGETPSFGATSPLPPGTEAELLETAPATTRISGLNVNTAYYYRLVATNEFGTTEGETRSFATLPNDPVVTSESASQVFPREVLLGAVVVPENANTTYHFVYGPTAGYGSSAPVSDSELGEGSEGLQALASVSGLQPGTTYHYAVVATNAGGSTYGPDETFTTATAALPVVVTGAAGEVSQNAAVVSGSVDAEGVPASYEWDLGTDTTYGTRVSGEAGSGSEPQTVTLSLQGLAAGTTYHYRLRSRGTRMARCTGRMRRSRLPGSRRRCSSRRSVRRWSRPRCSRCRR